jgi:hypothetical protein
VSDVYLGISVLATMLNSLVDRSDDAITGSYSYAAN